MLYVVRISISAEGKTEVRFVHMRGLVDFPTSAYWFVEKELAELHASNVRSRLSVASQLTHVDVVPLDLSPRHDAKPA